MRKFLKMDSSTSTISFESVSSNSYNDNTKLNIIYIISDSSYSSYESSSSIESSYSGGSNQSVSSEIHIMNKFQQQLFAYGEPHKHNITFRTTSNKIQFYLKVDNKDCIDYDKFSQAQYIGNNTIKITKQFEYNNITVNIVYDNNNVVGINLFNNNIDYIKIDRKNRIKYLNLNKNKLAYLNVSHLFFLQQILVCDNMLQKAFFDNKYLTSIDLSNNFLEQIDLSKSKFCKSIDLRNNKLSSIILPQKVLNVLM